MESIWGALGALPAEEPGPAARARFYTMLEAFRLGAGTAAPTRRTDVWQRIRGWLQFGPATWKPVVGMTCAALLVGLTVGHYVPASRQEPARKQDQDKLARLGEEVQQMRQLVALSLLQQQSASDRLRGVSWSVQVEPGDEEVLSALLRTMNTDPNVNVRLAAVEALQRFASNLRVRREMRQSLLSQSSPLVQLSLIDWVVNSKDRAAREAVLELSRRIDADPSVKAQAAKAAATLE